MKRIDRHKDGSVKAQGEMKDGQLSGYSRIECIRIVLSHLLFGGETFTELVENQIGVDRRYAAYQDYKHPFHDFRPYVRAHLRGTGEGSRRFRIGNC